MGDEDRLLGRVVEQVGLVHRVDGAHGDAVHAAGQQISIIWCCWVMPLGRHEDIDVGAEVEATGLRAFSAIVQNCATPLVTWATRGRSSSVGTQPAIANRRRTNANALVQSKHRKVPVQPTVMPPFTCTF